MSLEHGEGREVGAGSSGSPQTTGETPPEPEMDCLLDISKSKIEINPLLQPACDEIKAQLTRLRERLSNDFREANASLQATKKRRTELGDLLSQLQDTRIRQEQKSTRLNCDLEEVQKMEMETNNELAVLQQESEAEAALTSQKRAKVEGFQLELNKLAAQLQSMEGLNQQETSELAATQRAAWSADERLQRQLVQSRQRKVIMQQLRDNIERINELSSSDRSAAEQYSKEQQAKLVEARMVEEDVAATRKEAKVMHTGWENALVKLRNIDSKLEDIVSKREETEEKIAAAKREVAKMREEQGAESTRNWKRGHAVNEALIRRKEAERKTSLAEEELLKVIEAQKIAATATAEANAKLQRHQAEKREAERHLEELLVQKHRAAAAYNALEMKLSMLLDSVCEADSSLQGLQQELRVEKNATIEKAAQIADLDSEISKLEAMLQGKKEDLDTLESDIKDAKGEVRAALMHLEALQQQINKNFKLIEHRTRELQLLNKRKQEREEAGIEDDGAYGLSVEIKRLRKEIAATEDGKRAAQINWSQAQQRLLTSSQRHFQLAQALSDAENKLKETIITRNNASKSIQASEIETEHLAKRLQSLQKEVSRLDAGYDEMAKLENTIKNDLISQQAKHTAKLDVLQNACCNKERKIMAALKHHAKATTDGAIMEKQLQELAAEKKSQSTQIDEKRKLIKGEIQEATELQGKAAALRRKLSAAYKRRNTAAVLLKKAAVASGIDSSDRYVKVIKKRTSETTLAAIEAAKERLEALRLERKKENLGTSGMPCRKSSLSSGNILIE